MIAFVTDKKSFSYKIMKTGGTFIIAAILFLSLQAQTPVTGDDGTVRATSSSLHKAGKELLVSIEIEITRDFLPNESMTLVPVVSDSLEHRLELPAIYINSRKQHIIFLREAGKEGKRSRSIAKKKRKSATMHYLQPVPFESWMNLPLSHSLRKAGGCGIPGEEISLVSPVYTHSQPLFHNSYS